MIGALAAAAVAGGLLASCGSGGGQPADASRESAASAAAPVVPANANADAFLRARCEPARWARGTRIGLAVARPTRIVGGAGPHANAYAGMVRCLRELQPGTRPLLRTQLPIDALRRVPPGVHEAAELHSFAQLLEGSVADGVVSIRSHDFTRCGRRGAPAARQRDQLAPGEALQLCEFPSPRLYRELFTEVHAALTTAAPTSQLWWTAWNEPDHPAFTLSDRFGALGAARQAGRYWSQAAAVAGRERVLGGDFADRSADFLTRLREAFVAGAGEEPSAWAMHPYRDLTRGVAAEQSLEGRPSGEAATTPAPTTPAAPALTPGAQALPTAAAFADAIAPAALWLNEVTPLLSSRRGVGGDSAAQRDAGERLRTFAIARPVVVALYLLIPPPPPATPSDDRWDSALADRQGRARPFLCGLAALPGPQCDGDPAAFGG